MKVPILNDEDASDQCFHQLMPDMGEGFDKEAIARALAAPCRYEFLAATVSICHLLVHPGSQHASRKPGVKFQKALQVFGS